MEVIKKEDAIGEELPGETEMREETERWREGLRRAPVLTSSGFQSHMRPARPGSDCGPSSHTTVGASASRSAGSFEPQGLRSSVD